MRRAKQLDNSIDMSELALSRPLPPSIPYAALELLRADIVKYLDYVTHDLVQREPQRALREIQRVADRLTRITAMIPDAIAALPAQWAKTEPIPDDDIPF